MFEEPDFIYRRYGPFSLYGDFIIRETGLVVSNIKSGEHPFDSIKKGRIPEGLWIVTPRTSNTRNIFRYYLEPVPTLCPSRKCIQIHDGGLTRGCIVANAAIMKHVSPGMIIKVESLNIFQSIKAKLTKLICSYSKYNLLYGKMPVCFTRVCLMLSTSCIAEFHRFASFIL
jgi:hypothetical protein